MKCPFCGHPETRVVDSRDTEAGDAVRRRRECEACGQRFTTYEKVEEIPIMVVKRDGSKELFHPEKLLGGLIRACAKRQVDMAVLGRAVADIERQLREEMCYEVTSERLGELALGRLRDIDEVAYIRFASVYRQFDSVDDFKRELERLARGGTDD